MKYYCIKCGHSYGGNKMILCAGRGLMCFYCYDEEVLSGRRNESTSRQNRKSDTEARTEIGITEEPTKCSANDDRQLDWCE